MWQKISYFLGLVVAITWNSNWNWKTYKPNETVDHELTHLDQLILNSVQTSPTTEFYISFSRWTVMGPVWNWTRFQLVKVIQLPNNTSSWFISVSCSVSGVCGNEPLCLTEKYRLKITIISKYACTSYSNICIHMSTSFVFTNFFFKIFHIRNVLKGKQWKDDSIID